MAYVLGINEFFHDTSAALVQAGKPLAIIEEERLTRVRHAPGFALGGAAPYHAMDWCLESAGIGAEDVDCVAVSFDLSMLGSLGMLKDIICGNLRRTPFLNTLKQRFISKDPAMNFITGLTWGYATRRRRFLRSLRERFKRVVFVDHHLSHAASAFRLSGFESANIIVIDGMGDRGPTSLYFGDGDGIHVVEQYPPLESLGVLYRTITLILGFSFFHAGKTMGLAAYGEPDPELAKMLEITDGGYHVNWKVVKALGKKHARFGGDLLEVHKNLAATLQDRLEEAALALSKKLYERTGSRNLCMAGGVALNCNMNARLLGSEWVDDIFIQPGAMDMGCALGAALEANAQLESFHNERLESAYAGPEYADDEIKAALESAGVPYSDVGTTMPEVAADLLAKGKAIGWFQGRSEFGPRALGNRSILADPRSTEVRDRINVIKSREAWRPLAPAVLAEKAAEWFVSPAPSPFMTLTFSFRPEVRDKVAGVTHVDGSARVQTVRSDVNPQFHRLIQCFEERTGVPMVLNTSFNAQGDPIACAPADAIATFHKLPLDTLCIGRYLCVKD